MAQQEVRRLSPIVLTSEPAVDGVCSVRSERVPQGQALVIDHANCFSTSSTPTTLDLYEDNDQQPTNRLSGSDSGNRDEADYPQGLQIGPNRILYAVWRGASDGSVGTLRLQARDVLGGQ